MKKILNKIFEYEFGVPLKKDEYQQSVLYESGFIAFGSYFLFSFIEFLVAGCFFLNSSSDNFVSNLLAVVLSVNLLAMLLVLAFLKYKVRKSKIDLIDVTNEQSYETLVKKLNVVDLIVVYCFSFWKGRLLSLVVPITLVTL